MRRLLQLILVLLSSFYFFSSGSKALAISQFSTDYHVTYDVLENGLTHTTFQISQKNNLSTVYATSFSLSISQTKVQNIKVRDQLGQITPDVKTTDNLTNITFDFNQKNVGKDKANNFTIEYDTPDIASHQGSIWEINIPQLEPDENTNSTTISLKVPPSFGSPAYLDPKPSRIENNHTYVYNATSLANKSVSAVFGSTQYFKTQLTYNLTNPLNQPLSTQIAIPPNTPYQEVMINQINPPLSDLQVDPDGNWLASYDVPANSKLKVALDLTIKLNFHPKENELENKELYLRPTQVWDYQNSVITSKAGDLKTPKAIYDFVVNYLQYNYSRLENATPNNRPGAVYAFNNPNQAICTEFTDLFIALARLNGIPARELQGYAISTNDRLKPLSLTKDVLHSWPEYYDFEKRTWIQIDPTWGQTTNGVDYFNKLDLNHIVFAIHGSSPTQPLPAGAYKTNDSITKDVKVEVIAPVNFPKSFPVITPIGQKLNQYILEINNPSPVASKTNLNLASTPYTFQKEQIINLPPYSSLQLEVDLRKRPIFKTSNVNLIITLDGQRQTREITLKPYLNSTTLLILIGTGSVAGALFTRHLYLRRRRSQSPLHW